MKTLFAAQLALLPVLILMLGAASGHGTAGALLALILSIAGANWYRQLGRDPIVFWIAAGAALALAAGRLSGISGSRSELALVEIACGLAMGLGVLIGRPWTTAISAVAVEGMSATPLFHRINVFTSALWSVIFCSQGWIVWIQGPAAARWASVAAGLLLSLLVPKIWVRLSLKRRLERFAGPRWQPPAFHSPAPAGGLDVAVVGAGIGGLTAAALLARAGLTVGVFERQAVAGGFCHNWRRRATQAPGRPTFRFEAGVHDISGVWEGGAVLGVLKHLGVADRLSWLPVSHQRWEDGGLVAQPTGWEAYLSGMQRRFPTEGDAIRSALGALHAVYEAMCGGREHTAGVPLLPVTIDELERFARRNPIAAGWMERPFDEFLAHYKIGTQAATALGSISTYVTGERTAVTVGEMAPLFGYYLHGGFFPEGGTLTLAKALVFALTAARGRVHLRTPVASIVVEHGAAQGVLLEDGRSLQSRAVVCNADLLLAATRLVDHASWPAAFRQLLDETRPAASAFMVHLGVRGEVSQVPGMTSVREGDFRVSLFSPSNLDRTAATAGYSTLEITRLVPAEEAKSWFTASTADRDAFRTSEAYRNRKRAMGDRMVAAATRVVPDLADRIVFREEASPVTFGRYGGTSQGSIYGIEGKARLLPTKSPLERLVFAGSATRGPGIEAAMIAGATAAEALVPSVVSTPGQRP